MLSLKAEHEFEIFKKKCHRNIDLKAAKLVSEDHHKTVTVYIFFRTGLVGF
jgi:hypothetical protein